MPDSVKIGDIDRSVKVTEYSIIDPNHNCTNQYDNRANSKLVDPLVFMLNSLQLLKQQEKCWKHKTH